MGRRPNLQVTSKGPVLKRPNKHTGHKGYGRRGITRTAHAPTPAIVAVVIDPAAAAREAA